MRVEKMAMVCLHYKKETTITSLRDIMGTDIKGTNLIGLSKCAEELGFVSQAVKVDKEGFLSEYTLFLCGRNGKSYV